MGILIYLFYFVLLLHLSINHANCDISDFRLCADPTCSVPLSRAKTKLTYRSMDPHLLSFMSGVTVTVFSKEAGSNLALWGVEIDGKRGYVPFEFLQENKMFNKPQIVVPTELHEKTADGKILPDQNKVLNNVPKKLDSLSPKLEVIPKSSLSKDELQQKQPDYNDNNKLKLVEQVTEKLPLAVSEKHIISTEILSDPLSIKNDQIDITPTFTVFDGTTVYSSDETIKVETTKFVSTDEKQNFVSVEDIGEDDYHVKEGSNDSEDVEDDYSGDESETLNQKKNPTEVVGKRVLESTTLSFIEPTEAPLISQKNQIDNNKTNEPSNSVNNNNLHSTSGPEVPVLTPLPPIAADVTVLNVKSQQVSSKEEENVNSAISETAANVLGINSVDNNTVGHADNAAGEISSVEKVVYSAFTSNRQGDNVDPDDSQFDASTNENNQPGFAISNDPLDVSGAVTSDNIPESFNLKNIPSNFDNDLASNIQHNVNAEDVTAPNESANIHLSQTKHTHVKVPTDSALPNIDNIVVNDSTGVLKTETNEINHRIELDANNVETLNSAVETKTVDIEIKPGISNASGDVKINEERILNISYPEDSSYSPPPMDDSVSQMPDYNHEYGRPTQRPERNNIMHDIYMNSPSPLPGLINVPPVMSDLTKAKHVAENNQNHIDISAYSNVVTDTAPPPEGMNPTLISISNGEISNEQTENIISSQLYPDVLTAGMENTPLLVDSLTELSDSTAGFLRNENLSDNLNDNSAIANSQSVQVEELQPSEVTEDRPSMFSYIINSFGGIFGTLGSIFSFDGDSTENILKSDLPQTSNDLEREKDTNSQNEYKHTKSQDYLSTMFTASSQCNADDKWAGNWYDVSTDMIFWLVISAISVLMFTLGYYFLENRKQDGKLLAMVNSLQKELLCTSKECTILKDELFVTKEKLIGIEDSSFGSDEMVACLKKDVADAHLTIGDLQDKLTSAEEELANSTEAALELQSILDEQLSLKDTNSPSLSFTVANLQSQLDEQQTTMNLTKAQLASKVEENELLLVKISEIGSKTEVIEKKLLDHQEKLQNSQQENENKSQQIQEIVTNMEKALQQVEEQKESQVKEFQNQIKNMKEESDVVKVLLTAREQEVASLQDNLKLLKLDDKNIEAILAVSHNTAELSQAVSEKTILNEKLEAKKLTIQELNDKIEFQDIKVSKMKEQIREADQNTLQATSRLEVLTNYFNQKEADLLKELSTKEALWLSQRGEAMSTVDKIQNLQQEIQQYKETAEGVRRELAEQEAGWRAQVAALEKRVHEQWLGRRAAERAAEAQAREAQVLRHRLAAPEPDKRVVSPELADAGVLGGLGGLPPLGALAGLLPPPLGFLPPLPSLPLPSLPPPLLPPHRPPPLGRLSSPPPLQLPRPDRYEPNSRYSPDQAYSPERRLTPQHRVRSPFSPQDGRRRYNYTRRYDDDRYYDSEEDRRHRRYDETETDLSPPPSPPSPHPVRRLHQRNHKGASSGSGQSSDHLERISKHSGKF